MNLLAGVLCDGYCTLLVGLAAPVVSQDAVVGGTAAAFRRYDAEANAAGRRHDEAPTSLNRG